MLCYCMYMLVGEEFKFKLFYYQMHNITAVITGNYIFVFQTLNNAILKIKYGKIDTKNKVLRLKIVTKNKIV